MKGRGLLRKKGPPKFFCGETKYCRRAFNESQPAFGEHTFREPAFGEFSETFVRAFGEPAFGELV